jgi:hypothetical protein
LGRRTDGTGTIANLITANGTYGTLIQSISIEAIQTTKVTSGMIRLFVQPNGGASWFLIKEIPVQETYHTGQYPAFSRLLYLNLTLPNSASLGVSTENADSFVVVANCFDITGFI